jgi:major membrane immunogen (membrane-anchored lipoprotein)
MKKLFGFLAVGALTATLLAGCTSSGLQDGTYSGTSGADERGTYGVAAITIKGGKISDANYQEIQSNGLAKSAENGYTYQTSLDAMQSLSAKLVETQDINKVDMVSGATGTSNAFKAAVNSALAQADQNYKPVLRDGTYTLKTGLDSHGYYAVLTATIANNQFSEVNYQEFNQAGQTKQEAGYSYEYALNAMQQLPAKMNEVKDLSKVDDVTGASSTSAQFKSMMQMALDLAAAKDGVYNYESELDDHGYKSVGTLALHNGHIVGFQYAEVNADGVAKLDAGYPYEPALTFQSPAHMQQVISTQYGVDQVTGATSSFNNFQTTLKALVELAK